MDVMTSIFYFAMVVVTPVLAYTLLLERDVDVHLIDIGRWSLSIIKKLLKECKGRDKEGSDALMYAAAYGYGEIVKLLIEKGASIHTVDYDGYNALNYAVFHEQFEIAKMLIEKGANINEIFHFKSITIRSLQAFKNEIEEHKHLLTDENLKKWRKLRLSSIFC